MSVKEFYNEWVDHLSKETDNHKFIFKGLEQCNLEPGKTVLDLGCGTGLTTIFMARQGCKVTGVDFADKLIEYAEEHNSNKNTEYIVGDITEIDLEKPFDLIVLSDVIEHVAPGKLGALMETVQKHAHYLTVVYVNIPYHLFTEYGRDKFYQQPIETAIPMTLLFQLFEGAGWAPMDVFMYGTESPVEYVQVCFVTHNNLTAMWDHYHNPEPASSDEEVPHDGTQEKE